MKSKLIKEIKKTIYYGNVIQPETKKFDDRIYFSSKNFFKYKLSKIKIFIGDKKNKEVILGLQTFYTDKYGDEIENEENRDLNQKVVDTRILEIPKNDYITNFYLRTGKYEINQIKLVTKRGKELIAGIDEGEKRVETLNDKNDNMVLYFFGGYRKCLEALSVAYIPFNIFLKKTEGYFMLKKKMKDEEYKKRINFEQLSENDKILYKVCLLPDSCFYSILKFCFTYLK